MDLSSILPLLLKNNAAAPSGGVDVMSLLKERGQLNENSRNEMLMNMFMQNKARTNAQGIRPIKNIAPDDIAGKLVKYFMR